MSLLVQSSKQCEHCLGKGTVRVWNPKALRKWREKSGISIRAFAKRLNKSAPYLSDIERGRRNCTDEIAKAYAKL